MMRSRYLITFGRQSSEPWLRVHMRLRTFMAVVVVLIAAPIVFVVSATWTARTLVTDLLRQNASLRMENDSYRKATSELVAQVSTLQAAADDLGTRASVDPDAARAIERLPATIANRAMGGSASVAEITAPLTTVVSSADPAFGLLGDVIHLVERKLDYVKAGVERREALAAATPSLWPVAGWLSSTFGTRNDPFTGARGFHAGLDISADQGDAVRATAAGLVLSARYNGNFGNMVVLDHGFGIGTRYGHLSKFGVYEGQRVRKGEIIGYVGSTGRSTSPHLHYEVLLSGRPANPMRLLGH
jgi:murein DD-endopeptidase MepM/ murein hydrolase activator NlpD